MISLVNNRRFGTKKARIMEFFLDNPTKEIHARALSRKIKVSAPWVIKTAQELEKEGLVKISRDKGIMETMIRANRENHVFAELKRSYNLLQISESGLKEYLIRSFKRPECIILFGSYSKGEDTEQSDVDIAIIVRNKSDINVKIYEKKLQRQINIHQIVKEAIQKEFWNTLANGIIIDGYLDAV